MYGRSVGLAQRHKIINKITLPGGARGAAVGVATHAAYRVIKRCGCVIGGLGCVAVRFVCVIRVPMFPRVVPCVPAPHIAP